MQDEHRDSQAPRRLRFAVPVLGTIAVLFAYHVLTRPKGDTPGPADGEVEQASAGGRRTRAVPQFLPPAPSAAGPVEDERGGTATAGEGHGAWFDGEGSIVYEAPGARPRVVASPGARGPVAMATDTEGNVHFAWYDPSDMTIGYARIEPNQQDEDVIRSTVGKLAGVRNVHIRLEPGIAIEYTDAQGRRRGLR